LFTGEVKIIILKGEFLIAKSDFNHVAGRTETLKIFAPVSGFDRFISTTMSPLNLLTWTDGLGVKIPGMTNIRFYKEQTGQSNLY
jgi:hypothetical protein